MEVPDPRGRPGLGSDKERCPSCGASIYATDAVCMSCGAARGRAVGF